MVGLVHLTASNLFCKFILTFLPVSINLDYAKLIANCKLKTRMQHPFNMWTLNQSLYFSLNKLEVR